MSVPSSSAFPKHLVVQGALGVVLAWGGMQLRGALSRCTRKPHAIVLETCPTAVRAYPGLCDALSELGKVVGDAEGLRTLAQKAERISTLDAQTTNRAAQWEISRLSMDMESLCTSLVRRHNALGSDDSFRASLRLQEDVVPSIKNHLDSILHNHLLAQA